MRTSGYFFAYFLKAQQSQQGGVINAARDAVSLCAPCGVGDFLFDVRNLV